MQPLSRSVPNPNPNPSPDQVHGQCPHIGSDGKQIKEWDPSTVPVWTPPGVDPDAKGGEVMTPDWEGMDPKSRF